MAGNDPKILAWLKSVASEDNLDATMYGQSAGLVPTTFPVNRLFWDRTRNSLAKNFKNTGAQQTIADYINIVGSKDTLKIKDDFIGNTVADGNIGELGWFTNGNVADLSIKSGEANHPGIITLRANGAVVRFLGMNNSNAILMTDDSFDLTWIIRLNDITSCRFKFGIANGITFPAQPADAAYIRFDPAVNSHWQTYTSAAAASETINSTAITVAVSTWYKLRILKDPTNYDFYIDDVLQFTHSTNLPRTGSATAKGFCVAVESTVASPQKSVDIDFFKLRMRSLSR